MRHAHHSTSSTSPSALHRDKRQFQPAITTFFSRNDGIDIWDDDEDDDDERGPGPITRPPGNTHHHHHHTTPRSSLPGHVQADLLSVGMRVRKSVPEGYKTHKTSSLPTIQTTLSKAQPPPITLNPPRDPSDNPQHQRELLPFCGLHKIGGYAEQPVTNTHLYAGVDADGVVAVNIFPLPAEAFNTPFTSTSTSTSSAASSPSTDSLPPNPANPQKRSWRDDNDAAPLGLNANFLFAVPLRVAEDDVPVSPLSETPTHAVNALPALRPFAQPRTRRVMGGDAGLVKDVGMGMDMDFENAPAEGAEERLGADFGDAEFLRPWGGREVRMGGV